MIDPLFWQDRKVFLTGHTGFKGGWLSLWLQSMGAKVYGYALPPSTKNNFFTTSNVANGMAENIFSDVRKPNMLTKAMQSAKPEIVFHLAAQPLVRYSYNYPVETYEVNVMGTVNLFEAVRKTSNVKAVVNITTDKCYENREWVWGYRENDPMGGFDPYSSSKGCAELVTSAYRHSFLEAEGIALASARAGNVIGGGDWAKDRLIPDFLRYLDEGVTLQIRSPQSIRPWQHVLEPLSGYLILAERLYTNGQGYTEGWNFGSNDEDAQSVHWIVEQLSQISQELKMYQHVKWACDHSAQPHEAQYLKLDSSKAKNKLNWQTHWSLSTALYKTLEWHQAWKNGDDMRSVSLKQIAQYQAES